MRLATPFDPIEVSEVDNFAFDFTLDMGGETVASTSWTCANSTYNTPFDAAAQSYVRSATPQTSVQIRSPLDGSLVTRTGFFSVASIGGMPVTSAGLTYILEATVVTSGGRILRLNSTVMCKLPGP